LLRLQFYLPFLHFTLTSVVQLEYHQNIPAWENQSDVEQWLCDDRYIRFNIAPAWQMKPQRQYLALQSCGKLVCDKICYSQILCNFMFTWKCEQWNINCSICWTIALISIKCAGYVAYTHIQSPIIWLKSVLPLLTYWIFSNGGGSFFIGAPFITHRTTEYAIKNTKTHA